MQDYTFQYKDDGVILNTDPIDAFDPFVDINKVTGLDSAPYRITERDREGQDGGFIDAEFEKMRVIVLEGTIFCPTNVLEGYLDELKGNYAPSKAVYPFYYQAPGVGQRVVFCKSYGVKYDWDQLRRIGSSPVQFQLSAEDPTIYDATPVSASTGLAVEGTGRGYDRSYNYGYGGLASGGSVSVYNGGNRDTNATIVIYGPVDNPTVIHDISGNQLSFLISLSSNQYLVIDLRNKTVLLNGSASRYNTLVGTSRWFMLSSGNNSLRFLGSDPVGGTPDPVMTVTTRGAYR